MNGAESSPPQQPAGTSIRALLVRQGRVLLATAGITVGIELCVYWLVRSGGGQLGAVLASLAAAVLWTALAGPVLAAGTDSNLSALMRAGVVADASAVTLIVFWLGTPYVTFPGALEIYCTLAAMVLMSVAVVRCGRSEAGRYTLAVVVAAGLAAAVSTPFWTGGMLLAAGESARPVLVKLAVWFNPFYCVTAAIVKQTHFIWHQGPLMYHITRIGDYAAAPPASWYASAAACSILATILSGVKLLLSLRRRRAKR